MIFCAASEATLGALLGLRFASVQWSAYGGSYVYTSDPSSTFRDDVGTIDDGVLGITYEQNFTTPYLGLAGEVSYDNISLRGSVLASPFHSSIQPTNIGCANSPSPTISSPPDFSPLRRRRATDSTTMPSSSSTWRPSVTPQRKVTATYEYYGDR